MFYINNVDKLTLYAKLFHTASLHRQSALNCSVITLIIMAADYKDRHTLCQVTYGEYPRKCICYFLKHYHI